MAIRDGTVLQVRIDEPLKQAFAAAAQRERTTAPELLRRLMRDFVLESRRREAERQSALVASAPDAEESMDVLMDAQGFEHD